VDFVVDKTFAPPIGNSRSYKALAHQMFQGGLAPMIHLKDSHPKFWTVALCHRLPRSCKSYASLDTTRAKVEQAVFLNESRPDDWALY
jgi:hypothetical protein